MNMLDHILWGHHQVVDTTAGKIMLRTLDLITFDEGDTSDFGSRYSAAGLHGTNFELRGVDGSLLRGPGQTDHWPERQQTER